MDSSLIKWLLIVLMISNSCSGIENNHKIIKNSDFVKINRDFGQNSLNYRFHPYNYNGLVIRLKSNAPIFSWSSGEVIEICNDCKRSFGNYVLVKHLNNVKIKYYHLSQTAVKLGDYIEEGQTIGLAGNSGLTTIIGVGVCVWRRDSIIDPKLILNLPNF